MLYLAHFSIGRNLHDYCPSEALINLRTSVPWQILMSVLF